MAKAGRTIDENRTAEEQQEASTEGAWETPAESNGAVVPCKRHRWKGGDVCIRCGTPKSAVVKTVAGRTSAGLNATRRGGRSNSFSFMEMLLSTGWLLIGHGIEKLPTPLQEPWRKDGEPVAMRENDKGEIVPLTPAFAIGNTWKMESGVAGARLHRFGMQFPTYKLVSAMLEPVGKYADVGQLFAPPLFMGLAAMKPEVVDDPTIKGIMLGALIPILVEQAKMMERQNELLQTLEGATEAQINLANQIVDSMLGRSDGRTNSQRNTA
jgi:hypothetical protein